MLATFIGASANAATVLLSFSGSNYSAVYNGTSYALTAFAVNCTSATSGCTSATLDNTTHGLGILGNTANEIADYDYVVLDFSSSEKTALNTAGATGVSFTLYETNSGASDANIYGLNTNPTSPSLLSTSTIASDALSSYTSISLSGPANQSLGSFNVSGIYSYYVVDVSGAGCGVLITSAASPVPEPATFLLAGTALIGLAFAMKRRQQKS